MKTYSKNFDLNLWDLIFKANDAKVKMYFLGMYTEKLHFLGKNVNKSFILI